MIRRYRHCPFVTNSLTVKMKMWCRNFLSIWVSVRSAYKIKPRQNNDLSSTILHRNFVKFNATTPQVK